MKKLLILLLLAGFTATAQTKDSTRPAGLPKDGPALERLKQRLIELALKAPQMTQFETKKQINRYETNRASAAWLNLLSAQGNLNEFTIDKSKNTGNVFYPRYNFSLILPLGSFISIPAEVKITKANRKLLDDGKKEQEISLKTGVLKAYQIYATNVELLALQLPLVEDALNNYQAAEAGFKEETVTQQEYKVAYNNYNAEKVREVNLQREVLISKIELEGLIGMPIETVLLEIQ